MIIKDELLFIFVEKEGFVEMMQEASPSFKMSCRKSIRADCLKLFIEGKEELKSFFTAKCGGKVSITTDCWTSVQNFNYICITAHFVGINWKLHKKIINFRRIYSHKGVADAVTRCLKEWNLTNNFTVTVDNATANDTAIQHLKENTYEWGTNMLQGKCMHMRCVAHVTNLIVCEGLTEVGLSVRRVRESVRYVRSSPARSARFRESIEWYHISSKRFVSLDVATRWNSTFLMLESAESFEAAFKSMEADPTFVSDIGPPQHEDWVNVRKLLPFLGAFHDLTIVASGSRYVTAHLFFEEILKIFSHIMDMQICGDDSISSMADKMLEKVAKYWDEQEDINLKFNRLCYIANGFDPRHKFKFAKYAFTIFYEAEQVAVLLEELKEDVYEMFAYYQEKHDMAMTTSGSVGSTPSTVTLPTPIHTSTSVGMTSTSRSNRAKVLSGYLVGVNVNT
ncbi:Zinc finger BED domain-containing protein RICESLEEPER 2 [Linum perenne]